MQRKFTKEEIEQHDRLYKEGWRLLKPYMRLDGSKPISPCPMDLEYLDRARLCFEKCLAIAPEQWQTMWSIGKLHQCLNEHSQALAWFRKAAALAPTQPDVLNETGLEAMDTGDMQAAVSFFKTATLIKPDHAGYHANLALALLVSGSLQEAHSAITTSLSLAPSDSLSQGISNVIDRVLAGSLPQPHSTQDVVKALHD